ncbi:MAG: PH domain-containing protein [Planctomycetes bacterium]|nr:PH domain-containing protein [Planctomycetota bacterium]
MSGPGNTPQPTELVPGEEQVSSVPQRKKQGVLRSVLEKFTADAQDPKVVERVQSRIQDILMRDEELLYIAIQNKPIVKIAPDCIVLTNKRFIIYKPTVIGRVSFEDYVWRELRDAKLTEGIMGATISVQTAGGNKLSIDYLPKPQARQVYRLAQEQEEKALEERRQRSLEENRAAAGGVIVQSAVGTPAAPPTPETDDPVATLQKLKTMLDADLITTDEYEKKKAEIVARM